MKKVLIANRGEIARRVIRTLKKMNINSVAVFSDADRNAPHVMEADESVHLGGSPSSESYLRQDRILKACKDLMLTLFILVMGFYLRIPNLPEH
jgi:acetyl/propionyl-CoA carboxylase alpha subunit